MIGDNTSDCPLDGQLDKSTHTKNPTHKIINNKDKLCYRKLCYRKPYLRGVLHVALSAILPIFYAYMPDKNLSIESIILCCMFSGSYHQLTQYVDERYTPTFRLIDYLGSDMVTLSYAAILFEKHNDTFGIELMSLIVPTIFIIEFLLFHYHYHIKPLGEGQRMLAHILSFIFAAYPVIKYSDYMSPLFLLMTLFYFVSFYIFFTINDNEPPHYIWSSHESFHLVLLFAFFVHIYISIKSE